MRRRVIARLLITTIACGVLIAASDGDKKERRKKTTTTTMLAPLPMVDMDEQYYIEEQRQVDAYLAAVEEAQIKAYLEAMRPRIEVDWARWQRLHQCEQPDSWYAYGRFGNGLIGGGGLGMSDGAWSMAVAAARARGVELPGSVIAATPEQQMTGAQAFYDAHGWAWACRV